MTLLWLIKDNESARLAYSSLDMIDSEDIALGVFDKMNMLFNIDVVTQNGCKGTSFLILAK
jgi:hypothetical protein